MARNWPMLSVGLALVVAGCGGGSDPPRPIFIHVSSTADGHVLTFPVNGSGDVAPAATIVSPGGPANMAVDAAGLLYVANLDATMVTVYAEGATGNAAPVATIAGAGTGLNAPIGLTVDETWRRPRPSPAPIRG